jgi:hypothetical protein|tara:strand:+ start:1436 stop:1960 length:525 start_codon:yes stop_codon:yes gene_type:complete
MKKSILIALITVFTFSCNTTQKLEKVSDPIGHEISEEGTKISLYGGSMSTIQVWENYINAHNDGDLEAIRSLSAEKDFKVMGPRGELLEGSDAHIEFLTQWFADNSPKWKSNYMIANEFTNKEGELRQWVTSGHDLTMTVDGIEIKVNQVHDARIVDGKVQMFYVYERAESPVE